MEKLKDAAGFLFANKGYFDVGVRDVAARMGMSLGAVMANVPTKADLWRLAMGGPAPDLVLAEEVALLESQRPDWRWSLNAFGGRYIAHLSKGSPLTTPGGLSATGKAATPALALREARAQADRLDPLNPLIQRNRTRRP